MQLLKKERLDRAMELLPEDILEDLNRARQGVSKCDPYYSKIRVPVVTVAVAGGNHTLTVPAATYSCFDYAIGDTMSNAGYPTAAPYDKATIADTNLMSKSETMSNEFVVIDAISMLLMPRSDAELARRIWPELYCSIAMEGKSNFIRLGNPSLLGGGGGPVGNSQSVIRMPNNQDVRSVNEGTMTNGTSSVNDVKFLDDPIVWGPKGRVDSNLSFEVRIPRTITWIAPARTVDAANNITAFTPPAAQTAISDVEGTFLEFMVVLHSVQLSKRSQNR